MSTERDPNGPDGCAQRPPWATEDARREQKAAILSVCRKTPGWVMREPVGGTYAGKCVVFNLNGPQTRGENGWLPAVVALGNDWAEVHEAFAARGLL